MGSTSSNRDPAAWLASATGTDAAEVAAELEEGARRRTFVVNELLEAGFRGGELLDLVIRLTGLDTAQASALIRACERLVESPAEPVSTRDSRLAENELQFRRANEERFRAQTEDSLPERLEILCECADSDCRQPLAIATAEYEWLRQNPARFAVLPGHEAPAVEAVVERLPGCVIVELHEEAQRHLEGADPEGRPSG